MVKEYWELAKQSFEKDRSSEYALWIKPLKYQSEDESAVNVSAPNIFIKERVNERYLKLLNEYLKKVSDKDIEINISVEKNHQKDLDEIPFEEDSFTEELTQKVKTKPKPLPFLNPKFTFDRYIVGDNNNLAYIAAKKVVQSTGFDYNPFFLYGGVGLGKTHLAQAILHAIHEEDVTMKIVYVTTEQLLNEYVTSLKSGNMAQFRLRYRNTDALVIDDVQFLENTDKTQNELFNIYNTLKNEGKQMIFTCDRPPSKLVNITDRLISRFKSGLVIEIKKPSLEMRKKILELKLSEYNIQLDEEIIEYIAETVKDNIRDLESTVNRIRFLYCDMGIKNISAESIQTYLESIVETGSTVPDKARRVTVEQIQKIVANYYKIKYSDMKSKKRTNAIAKPRQIAMCLTRELTSLSTVEIGNEFGGRNHSTVLFAVDKIKKELEKGSIQPTEYESLKKEILS
jgi:chromosomal replication initiator protein